MFFSLENSFSKIQLKQIKKIVSNEKVYHVLTNEGLLYSFGNDYENFGILGMGNLINKISELSLNNFFQNNRIANISICEKYTVCYNHKSNIFIFGNFLNKFYYYPTFINFPNQYFYHEIKCSNNYFAVLDINGYLSYYGFIQKIYFYEQEKLSLKKVNFDYKNEAIEDFICLDNYICILSINKKVFLYNESGLYKIQINDSFNTIYQMKNCIFLFSSNSKIIYILEYNEHNFYSRTYKLNDNLELLGIVNNYIYNPQEIIFKMKGNYYLENNNIFTLIYTIDSNDDNNLILRKNTENKSSENLLYTETQINTSLNKLSQSLSSFRNNSINSSRIDRISKLLEMIFDNKINEIKRKRSSSANRKIVLEKINKKDIDLDNYLTKSYNFNMFKNYEKLNKNKTIEKENKLKNSSNDLVNIETFGNENNSQNNDRNHNNEIFDKDNNINITFQTSEENKKEKRKEIKKKKSFIQNLKIRINSRNDKIISKKLVTFKFDTFDKKININNNNNNISLDSIIKLQKIEAQKKKEIQLIQQKQKEKEEEIKKLKEIQINQEIEFLIVKKFNEEKEKEIKKLKDSEREKEIEIEKQKEKINEQKRRKQILLIDENSNENKEKVLSYNNNQLYKSSDLEEKIKKKKNKFLIRANSQIFESENKNLKLINNKKKEYSFNSNLNSSFNTLRQKDREFNENRIIYVSSKEKLFNIIKNKEINSLNKSFYYQIENENDIILKLKDNKFEIIKLNNDLNNNFKKGKTERIFNKVNSTSNFSFNKKNNPVKLSNSITLNTSKKKKYLKISNTNVLKTNFRKSLKRSISTKRFLNNKFHNSEQKLSFQNNNKKKFERKITPLKLISQKNSSYHPVKNKSIKDNNINIDKLTDKYINYLKNKYGNEIIENLKNKNEIEKELIKDFINKEIIYNNENQSFIFKDNFSSINEMEQFMNEHLKFENIKNKLKKIDNNLIVENYIPNNLIFYEEEEKNFLPFEPMELDYSIISKK